ncbi:MAG TPA: IS5 family transposase [Candidatus Angelobacter sp.]
MEQQLGLGQSFERRHAATRREQFLAEMERVVPWAELCAVIQLYYPVAGQGRRPIGLERMLRIYFMQQWFTLSDPAMEDALYDSRSMSTFAKLDLVRESAPDETTICKFRHLIEEHSLGASLFAQVQSYLERQGIVVSTGTIVDATLISASASTKNRQKQRDPEASATRKGPMWYFGYKGHIGMDRKTKVIHHYALTTAKVHDSRAIPQLLHGKETEFWGDSAYYHTMKHVRPVAPHARDRTMARGFAWNPMTPKQRHTNRQRAKIRGRVEHGFGVMKNLFGFRKTRYRGLQKNENRFAVLCTLANLYMQRRKLSIGSA